MKLCRSLARQTLHICSSQKLLCKAPAIAGSTHSTCQALARGQKYLKKHFKASVSIQAIILCLVTACCLKKYIITHVKIFKLVNTTKVAGCKWRWRLPISKVLKEHMLAPTAQNKPWIPLYRHLISSLCAINSRKMKGVSIKNLQSTFFNRLIAFSMP